jgi:hypothetical protein
LATLSSSLLFSNFCFSSPSSDAQYLQCIPSYSIFPPFFWSSDKSLVIEFSIHNLLRCSLLPILCSWPPRHGWEANIKPSLKEIGCGLDSAGSK